MEKNVDLACSVSGSKEIQIARPIPDIGASRPTVSYMTAISTNGVPVFGHKPSFVSDWFGAANPVNGVLIHSACPHWIDHLQARSVVSSVTSSCRAVKGSGAV